MAPKFVFQTYPKAWLDHYSSNGLLMVDPMVAWGFSNEGTERWSNLDDSSGVMKLASEYGMKFGAVVAVNTNGSRSLGGLARSDRELTDEEIELIFKDMKLIHDATADTSELNEATLAHLKKMAVMVTHPGS
ncbi:autoinducer binding domain-containing protein [Yoonia litorea]|nr:autoinducer binding domain-containing protein [Yoonia litorea]